MAVYVRSLDSSRQQSFSKVSVSDENFSIEGVHKPPFPESTHKIVGYCKGLFCLEFENGRYVLWNPSKNEIKLLPPSDMKIPHCPSPHCPVMGCVVCSGSAVRGLGFDPISKDYKVVRFVSNFYNHITECYSIKQVEVYSLVHDSWEEIGTEGEQINIIDDCATYLDGRCYWMGHKSANDDHIVSLDMSSNEFSTLVLPPRRPSSFPQISNILTEFENSLAYLQYQKTDVGNTRKPKNVCCWVRGVDDEWVKRMSFEFPETLRMPLRFCGGFLLFERIDGGLLAYDLHKTLFRKIEGIYNYSSYMLIFPFIKSKVHLSIEEENRQSKSSLIPHKRNGKKKRREEGEKEDDESKQYICNRYLSEQSSEGRKQGEGV